MDQARLLDDAFGSPRPRLAPPPWRRGALSSAARIGQSLYSRLMVSLTWQAVSTARTTPSLSSKNNQPSARAVLHVPTVFGTLQLLERASTTCGLARRAIPNPSEIPAIMVIGAANLRIATSYQPPMHRS